MCNLLFTNYASLALGGGEGKGWEKWEEEEQWQAGVLGSQAHTTYTYTHAEG